MDIWYYLVSGILHNDLTFAYNHYEMEFPSGSVVKNLPANARATGDPDSIPGSGRPPGEGNGNPLQYSCLGNSMDRGAWWATVHAIAESDTTEVTENAHTLYEMITVVSLDHTHYLCLYYIPRSYLLCNWKFVHLHLLDLLCPLSNSPLFWQSPICSLYESIFILVYLF